MGLFFQFVYHLECSWDVAEIDVEDVESGHSLRDQPAMFE